MKNIQSTWHEWYSIIAAVLMIGFLLVLTTSTLNLVLQEMQDSRGKQDYIKAYAAAEWSLELALLKVKEHGYGYDDDSFESDEILWEWVKIAKISYQFDSKVHSHSWTIAPYGSDIIPLFSIRDDGVVEPASNLNLIAGSDVVWNIITENNGVSGLGWFNEFTNVWQRSRDEITGILSYDSTNTVWSILSWQDYLILQNLNAIPSSYDFSSTDGFTLPRAIISSSATVGKYKQNIQTRLDNTEFLGILKYSIYSWN